MATDILVFVLLGIIVVGRWVAGDPYLLPLLWLGAFSVALVVRERRIRQRTDFVSQLKSQRKELRHGGSVAVNNLVLRYNSVLTTFHLSVGGVFVSVDIPSRYQPASAENHPEAFIYSVCSLVSGWWSFPHGPLHTIHALMHNLRGGEHITVAQLIDGVLLERRAQVQHRAVEMHRAARKWKQEQEKASEERLPETGPGSRSQLGLSGRTATASSLSLEDRLRELYSPTPVGTRVVEALRERVANTAADAKEKLKKAVRRGKDR